MLKSGGGFAPRATGQQLFYGGSKPRGASLILAFFPHVMAIMKGQAKSRSGCRACKSKRVRISGAAYPILTNAVCVVCSSSVTRASLAVIIVLRGRLLARGISKLSSGPPNMSGERTRRVILLVSTNSSLLRLSLFSVVVLM